MDVFSEIIPLLLILGVVGILWHLSRKAQSRARAVPTPAGDYEVIVTDETLSCTHPSRPTETVRWNDIVEIRLVTTSDGPLLPDMWFVFVGRIGGCSLPSEAKGFEQLWPVFDNRFPGFDHGKVVKAEVGEDETTLWKANASS